MKQTLENGTYGYEFEISDVNLHEAAKAVFENQGLDFSDWRDRGKTKASKIRKYEIYNVSSDYQEWNNDGSRAGHTVMVDGKLVKATEENAHLWKNAEVISPVLKYSDVENDQLEEYLELVEGLGGRVSPDCWNDFNIHVGVDGWEVGDVQEFMTWYMSVQDILLEFRVPFSYREEQLPSRYAVSKIVYNRMMRAETKAEMLAAKKNRPILAIHTWADDNVPYNTLEWRMWPMLTDTLLLRSFIDYSVRNTYGPDRMSRDETRDWMDEKLTRALVTTPYRLEGSKAPVDEKSAERVIALRGRL